jgi:hypothetical protein
MYLLIGHKLTQGDVVKYEPIHVDNTQDYRSKIVRGLTVNEVTIMEDDLEVLGDAMSSMLDILDQEGARPEE